MNPYRYMLAFFLISLPYRAISQQRTGTIVVFSTTPNKAIVAADSRAVTDMHGAGKDVIENDQCKILAFDNKAIFALAGFQTCFGPTKWDVLDTTKEVYADIAKQDPKRAGINMADLFIKNWYTKMVDSLSANWKFCPQENQIIMAGVFIDFNLLDRIESRTAIIKLPISGKLGEYTVDVHTEDLTAIPQGAGEAAILIEFLANESTRAKQWHTVIDKYPPERKVQALAQLTRRLDKSGNVGGNIDMAVLTDSGIRWVSTKKNCAHQQKY